MKTMNAVLSVLFLASFAQAEQRWTRTCGGKRTNEGRSVRQTSDGGYIIAGNTDSFRDTLHGDVYLIKTNASGETLWTRTYGGKRSDEGNSVQQTSDGGYIIAGSTYSFRDTLSGDVYLIKTNASGDTQWTRTYGGSGEDEGRAVRQTSDGGYIVAGTSGYRYKDVYLIKTNASGDTLWTRTFGGPDDIAVGNSVQQTSDGGYIITGSAKMVEGNGEDIYLVKTNASGDTLWTRTFGGSDDDVGNSVQQTSDGGYVITGYTTSFGEGGDDVYLVKTNASGETLWTRTYGASDDEEGNSVQQTSDGGYVIAGKTSSSELGDGGVYLVKTNASGETLWTSTYGDGNGIDEGASVQQTSDSGYIITGSTYSSEGGVEGVYLIKTDAAGDASEE